jgi:hypothetical protein
MRLVPTVLSIAMIASPALATDSTPAPASDRAFTCDSGPLVKTLTRATLAAAFGKANVTDETIADGDGAKKTVLFAKTPDDRVEILWQDNSHNAAPNTIAVTDRSHWRGPLGLHIGSTLAEVEKANGRPFTLMGFGSEGGGGSVDWRGGALAGAMKDCGLDLTFASAAEGAAETDQAMGSDSKAMRGAKAVVVGMVLNFVETR